MQQKSHGDGRMGSSTETGRATLPPLESMPKRSSSHPNAAVQAYTYFEQTTEASGMKAPITRALERAQQRTAQQVDIVVHPEFAWHPRSALCTDLFAEDLPYAKQQTDAYGDAIETLMHTSPNLVVLGYADARTHRAGLPYKDTETIVTASDPQLRSIQGMLDATGMRRLLDRLDGIREDDRIHIHGAAWNRCPKTLARQLLGIAVFGQFIPPYVREAQTDDAIRTHTETLLTVLYQIDYVRQKTAFRMGIQHNSQNTRTPDSLTTDMSDPAITRVFAPHGFRSKNLATQ